MRFSHIAIPTQRLQTRRIPCHPDFLVEPVTANVLSKQTAPVVIAVTVDVVERKKSNITFPTTDTRSPIMFQYIPLEFIVVSPISRFQFVWIVCLPRSIYLRSSLFLFWSKCRPALGIIFVAVFALFPTWDGGIATATNTHTCIFSFLFALSVVHNDYILHKIELIVNICAFNGTKAFKLFLQLAGCYSLEQTDDFRRSKFRRCANKQMHMVGHNLNCQYLETVLCGDFCQQLFQPCLNRPNQNHLSIARYPNQMVIDYIRAVWAMVDFVWHRPILAKERGFLHPLKRSGFRREDL
jgi:hypothetical protein